MSTARVAIVLAATLVVAACRSPAPPELPPQSNVLQAGHAPTPYSAAQIRDACRGHQLRQQFTSGETMTRRLTRFPSSGASDTEAEIEAMDLDAGGKPTGAPQSYRVPWAALQAHASFPAASTTIISESCTTPAGTFDCWRYEVREAGAVPSVRRFWFAKQLPGPPVRMEVEVGGKLQSTMVLVERR